MLYFVSIPWRMRPAWQRGRSGRMLPGAMEWEIVCFRENPRIEASLPSRRRFALRSELGARVPRVTGKLGMV